MTTVAFDLDGTLVTAGPRQAWLLRAAARVHGVDLDVDAAWEAKREGASNLACLAARGIDAATARRINALWLAQVETPYWLLMDTLLPGVAATLEDLARRETRCVLVTARANPFLMRQQTARLGLACHFAEIHCVAPARARQEKAAVLRRIGAAYFIGDAESDADAARDAGVPFAGVTTGQRSAGYLVRHGVRHVYGGLAAAVDAGRAGLLG